MNIKITLLAVLASAYINATPVIDRIKEIKSIKQYEAISKNIKRPTVFIFNSATCEACKMMNKGLNAAARKYHQADFYIIHDLKSDDFKGLPQKLKIKGYPTTFLCKPGAEACIERGSIEAQELDDIIYKLVHGKAKPAKTLPVAPAAKETKTSPKPSAK